MHHNRFITSIFLLVFATSLMAQSSTLFDGKIWNGYGFTAKLGQVSPLQFVQISDGIIHMSGSTPGYLMSTDVYSNFRLTAEFRWVTDSAVMVVGRRKTAG